jgi:hypothetical protein
LELEYPGRIIQLELEILWGVVQLELDISDHVVQLELDVLCCDVQLELDVRLVNRSIKSYLLITASCKSNSSFAILVVSPHVIFFLHLLSSNHKSTQTCLHHCFRWN